MSPSYTCNKHYVLSSSGSAAALPKGMSGARSSRRGINRSRSAMVVDDETSTGTAMSSTRGSISSSDEDCEDEVSITIPRTAGFPEIGQHMFPVSNSHVKAALGEKFRNSIAPLKPSLGDAAASDSVSTVTCPDTIVFGRISVWRSNDWHPISDSQDRQMRAYLTRGCSVFDISDGPYTWTIDTTGPDGWVQISKSSGRRLALKCDVSELYVHSTIRASEASIRVPTRPVQERFHRSTSHVAVPKGDTALALSLEAFDVSARFSEQLQQEWKMIHAALHKSSKDTSLSKEDMVKAWVQYSGGVGFEYNDLIEQTITSIFLKMDLQKRGAIEEEEWFHYWLLEQQAPSLDAFSQVNQKLVSYLQKDPSILRRLTNLFRVSCMHLRSHQSDVQMSAQQLTVAAHAWLDEARKCDFMQDIDDYLTELLLSKDLEEGQLYSYYDFMNHVLGRRKAKVQLYQYDLTKGSAKWLSPLLLGQQVEGLWHTSIVVFGGEYWYGGSVFEAPPGSTHYGKPNKIIDLPEQTMRTKADFIRHIKRKLAHDFTAANYDTLTHNCNHFTDAATQFLLNTHIPQDILMQPDLVTGSWSFPLLRPILNRVLGQCRASGSTKELSPKKDTSMIRTDSDVIVDGSLILWDDDDSCTRIARVLAVNRETETCTFQWLDVRTGELYTAMEVSICQVRKLRRNCAV